MSQSVLSSIMSSFWIHSGTKFGCRPAIAAGADVGASALLSSSF
jgi:hypothetical protein